MKVEVEPKLAGNFNFEVSLRRSPRAESGVVGTLATGAPAPGDLLCDGGFQECSGLDIEMDVAELVEGGRNDGIIRRVGRGKYSNIVLKRGMFYGTDDKKVNDALWKWMQGILEGALPVPRYDGQVKLRAADGVTVLATWTFVRGLPQKVAGPSLNAKTGDVAMEELHIAHEGLRLGI